MQWQLHVSSIEARAVDADTSIILLKPPTFAESIKRVSPTTVTMDQIITLINFNHDDVFRN